MEGGQTRLSEGDMKNEFLNSIKKINIKLLPHEEKKILVLELREAGWSRIKIAKELNLTHERIRQIEFHAKKWLSSDFPGLSNRISNCLKTLNLKTKEDVLNAFNEKRISLKKTKNLGIKGYLELCNWLNINPIEKLK